MRGFLSISEAISQLREIFMETTTNNLIKIEYFAWMREVSTANYVCMYGFKGIAEGENDFLMTSFVLLTRDLGVPIHWTGLLDWTTGLDYWTGL